jgi:hypothetical protein
MIPGRIPGATRVLGAPAGWDVSANGLCSGLAIRDCDGVMLSSWQPSPEEIERIVAGAPVHLYVWGAGHPPVALEVPLPPDAVDALLATTS